MTNDPEPALRSSCPITMMMNMMDKAGVNSGFQQRHIRRTAFGRVWMGSLVVGVLLAALALLHNMLVLSLLRDDMSSNHASTTSELASACAMGSTHLDCLGVGVSPFVVLTVTSKRTSSSSFDRHGGLLLQGDDSNDRTPWYRSISECVDHHVDCAAGADRNGCAMFPNTVLRRCPASCKVCNNVHDNNRVISNCYGVDQIIPSKGPHTNDTVQRIAETEDYMFQQVYVDEKYNETRAHCKNRYDDCALRAVVGKCETRKYYMLTGCAPSCFTCEMLDIKVRCPFDPTTAAPSTWQPGDLNRMFERIVDAPEYKGNNVRVLSSPASYQKRDSLGSVNDGPWLIILEDFLSPEECNRLIQWGHRIGYTPSVAVGNTLNFDGSAVMTNTSLRTSGTVWCQTQCSLDPIVANIQQRLVDLTGIPDLNSESPQLLRYEQGQYYRLHTDYHGLLKDRQPGVRVLTVFLYLNNVESGGGTHFPFLGDLVIQPKQGRIVLWPSVLNNFPDDVDNRTMHQALPVEAGVKYSVNSWFHQRDWKGPIERNCHQ